jgi:hypothetical protein
MSLEAALGSLRDELARLQDTVSALRVTVMEDAPRRGGVVLVDRLDNVVTDLSSAVEEADARAALALPVGPPNGTFETLRAAMREIHRLIDRFQLSYVRDLAHHDRIAELLAMGRERERGWREWSREVKTAIERCAAPMAAAANAMAECWSELAERLARSSVSVQATNIGQQITVRDDDQLEIAGKAT